MIDAEAELAVGPLAERQTDVDARGDLPLGGADRRGRDLAGRHAGAVEAEGDAVDGRAAARELLTHALLDAIELEADERFGA